MHDPEVIAIQSSWRVRVWYRHRNSWMQRHFRRSMVYAALAFVAALVANAYAVAYATERASNYVTDIVLSNTRPLDVGGIAVWGAVLLIAFIAWLCIERPERTPFVLYSLAIFFSTRAVFLALTHLGPFPDHTAFSSTTDIGTFLGRVLIGGGDLFFSAHTGVPFLMALLYWHRRGLRNFFLTASVFFGAVMLLGHLHYTIDVVSAFFITYAIYSLALWLFPGERALFLNADFNP